MLHFADMMKFAVPVALRLILPFLLTAYAALGSGITPVSNGFASGCLDPTADQGACGVGSQSSIQSVNFGTASVNATLSTVDSSDTVDAIGSGNFGQLHAFVTDSITIGATPTYALDFARGLFVDGLTVNDAALDGTPGSLLLSYTIDGTVSDSGSDIGFAVVNVNVGTQGYESPLYFGAVNSSFAIPMSFSFIYGQQFPLGITLTTISFIGDTTGYSSNVSGTAKVNFGDTLTLSGITLEDASGNVVSGSQITSASGTQYGPNGVQSSTPEPSGAYLLALGLMALGIGHGRVTKK